MNYKELSITKVVCLLSSKEDVTKAIQSLSVGKTRTIFGCVCGDEILFTCEIHHSVIGDKTVYIFNAENDLTTDGIAIFNDDDVDECVNKFYTWLENFANDPTEVTLYADD